LCAASTGMALMIAQARLFLEETGYDESGKRGWGFTPIQC